VIRALVVSLEGGSELSLGTEGGVILLNVRGGIAELDAGAARIVGRSLLELAAELELVGRIGELVTAELEPPASAELEPPASSSPRSERLERYLARRANR
jgi:hypothetical protein